MHALGFLTGIVLYAMLGVMAWQQRPDGRMSRNVVTNAGGAPHTSRLLAIATLGLLLSILGNVLHLDITDPASQPWSQPWSQSSLQTGPDILSLALVSGYAILMALIVVHLWRRPGTSTSRILALAAIAIFAASAFHYLLSHSGAESVWVELAVHYAPLPLVGTLLYREYRFALADVFLKRALTLVLLVAIAAGLQAIGQQFDSSYVTLCLWIATALMYPGIHNFVTRGIDRFVLRRKTHEQIHAQIAEHIENDETPEDVLAHTCLVLQDALATTDIQWKQAPSHTQAQIQSTTQVQIPVAEAPRYVLHLGPLAGGRRLLSEDFDMLDHVALDVARRIDILRITHERYERSAREAEMRRLATEAELRALHAQLNPHFLFNALTTIGYLIQSAPQRALDTLLKLTDLLRAVLRRTSGDLVTVREEAALVEAYLAIERERFEERLSATVTIPQGLERRKIPPLIIQPLVENAIKHGISPRSAGGTVNVTVDTIAPNGIQSVDPLLRIRVHDTGAGVDPAVLQERRDQGIGLSNIERRIQQYYGESASITITSQPGQGTLIELILP